MSDEKSPPLKRMIQSIRSNRFFKKSNEVDKSALNKKEILKKLNGTTLMVYFVLMNKKEIGVRALQRNLELSSPSVARYHLEKLSELNLVKNNNGVYQLIRRADIPVLSTWILFGKWLLPRSIFMAFFSSLFFLGYLIFIYRSWNRDSSVVIFSFGLFLIYLWYDVFTHFKNRPI
ncbi:MAG: hypothetical protein ACTSYI_17510 [Promethearchaeota archaeon]